MTNTSFFDESREQSLIKAEIVAKYFLSWAKIIIPQAKKEGKKLLILIYSVVQVATNMALSLPLYLSL
ncbi:hypothetical protein DP117_22720 [Brasilonema sp. UFV-L1]|uniref:hypothetical protein n=1 Tax=Brasilonema sp. UFV-L1 TaxID=2234130 RepID=UPI0016ACFD34|nr:hypothetical protein [Brasilonema sp. UFV-L1]